MDVYYRLLDSHQWSTPGHCAREYYIHSDLRVQDHILYTSSSRSVKKNKQTTHEILECNKKWLFNTSKTRSSRTLLCTIIILNISSSNGKGFTEMLRRWLIKMIQMKCHHIWKQGKLYISQKYMNALIPTSPIPGAIVTQSWRFRPA